MWMLCINLLILILTISLLQLYIELAKEQFILRGEMNMLMKLNTFDYMSMPSMSSIPFFRPEENDTTTIELEEVS